MNWETKKPAIFSPILMSTNDRVRRSAHYKRIVKMSLRPWLSTFSCPAFAKARDKAFHPAAIQAIHSYITCSDS